MTPATPASRPVSPRRHPVKAVARGPRPQDMDAVLGTDGCQPVDGETRAPPKLRIASTVGGVPEVQDFEEAVAEVWRDGDGTVCAWAQTTDGERWMHLPGVASYRLRPGASEVTAIPDPSAGSQLVASGYERTVLPMAVQLAGQEVLHASAVLTAGGVVAFCAVSTTGKSTIAHGFSQRGYGLWADDAVAFDTSDVAITLLALPFRLSLRGPPGRDDSDATATAAVPDSPAPEPGVVPLSAVCVLERARLADVDGP